MASKRTRFIRLITLVTLAIPITLYVMSLLAKKPDDLGVVQGRLKACPDSPNCVSSQAKDHQHAMEPIPFFGSVDGAMKRLRQVLGEQPRTKIITDENGYLHAECRSLIFRFVDDVEFVVDERVKVIHFRSASRVGHSDMGVNRSRMEQIRAAFENAQAKDEPSKRT